MLVDVHVHIGTSPHGVVAPVDIVRYAVASGIDAVLISNRDAATQPHGAANLDEVDANQVCLRACRAAQRLLPLYWVRVGRPDSHVHALRGALTSEPFAGAVFSPGECGFDAASSLLPGYLDVLAALRRPALFCLGDDEGSVPRRICDQLPRHPDLPVVLCLCGGGGTVRAAAVDVAGWARQRREANLYVDTSHAAMHEVEGAIRVLGAERVLFGSEGPGTNGPGTKGAGLADLRNTLSPEEFRQVAGANAARLFSLTPGAT